MTSPIDNQNNSELDDELFDFYDDYGYDTEQSLFSEPIRPTRDYRAISRLSLLSKEGQILIRREVPLKLRETIGRKYVKIPVYESSLTPNHRIKNAITGQTTHHRVGTKAESLYFKVCLATGVEGRKEPINLFFETPVEFEKHFLETVKDDVKEKWAESYRVAELAYYSAKPEKELHMQRYTFVR